MEALALTTLFIGASVGLRLQEAGEVPLEQAIKLTDALARALERGHTAEVSVDDPVWSSCPPDDRCADQVRARTSADDVVLFRVFGGLNKMRVVALRFRAEGGEPTRIEVDVPRASEEWPDALRKIAASLFPDQISVAAPKPTPADVAQSDTPKTAAFHPAPWVFLSVGAASAAAGIAFGISSRNARTDSANTNLSEAEFNSLADRAQVNAIVADILYGVAAACAIAGALLFVWSND